MKDEQIETFLSVVKYGSFSKAEQHCYISKQSMFKQIQKMEEELSCQLFFRTPKGIQLTEVGQFFYENIQVLEQRKKELFLACKTYNTTNTLKLGHVEHQVILNCVTEEFRKQYPEIQIQSIIHPNHSGEYRVMHQIMDVGETFKTDFLSKDLPIGYTKLLDSPYYVAMRKSHPLATQKTITPEDCTHYITSYYPVMLGNRYTKQLEHWFQAKPDHLDPRKDFDNQVGLAYQLLENDQLLLGANPFIYNIDGLTVLPYNEPWSREYGIIYPFAPNSVIQNYVNLAIQIYKENPYEHFIKKD